MLNAEKNLAVSIALLFLTLNLFYDYILDLKVHLKSILFHLLIKLLALDSFKTVKELIY